MSQNVIAQQKLFLNADKSKLVGEGDEAAAFLFCVPGDEIIPEVHEQFGLVDGALPEKAAKKEPKGPAKNKAETKPAATGETKPAEASTETKDA